MEGKCKLSCHFDFVLTFAKSNFRILGPFFSNIFFNKLDKRNNIYVFPVSDIYFKTNRNETLQVGLRVEKRLAEDYFIVYLEVETEANNKTLTRSMRSLRKYMSKKWMKKLRFFEIRTFVLFNKPFITSPLI